MAKKIVHLLGSISSGKGFTCKSLTKSFGNSVSIIGIGNLVRDRLKADQDFFNEWGQWIKDGKLLPDEVAIQLLNSGLHQPHNDILVIEGFDRTPDQVVYSYQRKLIPKGNTLVLRLNASEQVCYRRHQHRNHSNPDGQRTDTSFQSFRNKHQYFVNYTSGINDSFRRYGVNVIDIDANGDLQDDVYPQVHHHFQKFLEQIEQPKRVAVVHNRQMTGMQLSAR